MTTAFVLSGGASLGAVQVGMLAALAEADITPDLIVGSSVGAVNGAWIAGRRDTSGIAELAKVWSDLTRDRIFPTRPLTGLLGFLGGRNYLAPNTGIRRLLEKNLAFARLEDAPTPLYVTATDVLTGQDVVLAEGNAIAAILASTAIPGVFPPVRLDGRLLMDGGVVNNAPISHAVDLGADTIYVLDAGYSHALTECPTSALGMAVHALTLMTHQRVASDLRRHETTVDLRVVPSLFSSTVSPIDFSRAPELIETAHRETLQWLRAYRPSPIDGANVLTPITTARRRAARRGQSTAKPAPARHGT